MIEVEFLTDEPGAKKTLGYATFASVPLAHPKDFRAARPLSYKLAQVLADQLAHDVVCGKVLGMLWRVC